MVGDKNANERFACDQKIIEIEDSMDYLQGKKREIQQLLEDFDVDVRRWYSAMQESNEQVYSKGKEQRQMIQEEMDGIYQFSIQFIDRENEDITASFGRSIAIKEEQRTEIQRERNNLPWD